MTNTVMHLFYDIYMGYQHAGLYEILREKTGKDELPKGQLAVFINTKWTACKILTPGNSIFYHREPSGAFLTPQEIRQLPTVLGAAALRFGGNTEERMLRAFEKQFGTKMARLKAVN